MKKYNNNQFIYFEVALPLPFYQTFTYKLSLEKYDKLKNKKLIGRRVLVPFRKSGYTGIITEIHKESFSEIEDYEVKEIEELPDDKPLFTEKELNIAYKISDYYVAPFGLTLYYFIPEGLRWKKKEGKWIKTFPESYIYGVGKIKNDEKLSERQKELVELVSSLGEVSELELIEQGFTKTTINSLVKKGILKRENFIFKKEEKTQLKQKKLEKTVKVKKGIFYYGADEAEKRLKTYTNIIKNLQEEGKSSLLVFPSIAHIKKAYEILSKEINNLYVYHDGISARENVKTWFELQEKEGSVLLTSYSGILIPIKNLSFIVVEEEAADSYKTLRTPKFDVRRAIFEIYKEKKLSLIYSSLVPSVESFYSIEKNIVKPLKENFLNVKYKANIKNYPFDKEFSLKKLIEILKDNKKTLIIANKKAYASFLYCPRCENEILCQNCDVPLKVYKKEKEYLECSICKTKYETITRCPECETPLETVGIGIEKVEEYLKKYFSSISYLHEEKDTNIKLTTTILDKDLTTENFERVINIYPDFFLFVQDFKGREKFFRNILYSYIKAEKEFILFTNQSNDVSIKAFLNKKLEKFYKDELNIREKFNYPPFKRYILLTFEKKNLDINFLNELFKIWIKENKLKNVKYKGIFKGYHSKVKGKERAQLLLIDFKNKQALKILHEKCRKLGIKLIIDVDPVQII